MSRSLARARRARLDRRDRGGAAAAGRLDGGKRKPTAGPPPPPPPQRHRTRAPRRVTAAGCLAFPEPQGLPPLRVAICETHGHLAAAQAAVTGAGHTIALAAA